MIELTSLYPEVDVCHRVTGQRIATVETDPRLRASGLDLDGADLRGVNLRRAYLRGSNLRGACLDGCLWSDARLQAADLSGASCRRIKGGVDGTLLNANRADFEGADLRVSDLQAASFRNANLRNAKLTSSDLTGTDFAGANLAGADLRGSWLEGARFTDAVLDDVLLPGGMSIQDLNMEPLGPWEEANHRACASRDMWIWMG